MEYFQTGVFGVATESTPQCDGETLKGSRGGQSWGGAAVAGAALVFSSCLTGVCCAGSCPLPHWGSAKAFSSAIAICVAVW